MTHTAIIHSVLLRICRNTRAFYTVIVVIVLLITNLITIAYSENSEKELSIGESFHYETTLTWRGVLGDLFRTKPEKPPQYNNYTDTMIIKLLNRNIKELPLKKPLRRDAQSAIIQEKPVTMSQLSQLVFSAQGTTGKMYGQPLRTTPSAGALYPFEIYVIANNVDTLDQGIYHYAFLIIRWNWLKVEISEKRLRLQD